MLNSLENLTERSLENILRSLRSVEFSREFDGQEPPLHLQVAPWLAGDGRAQTSKCRKKVQKVQKVQQFLAWLVRARDSPPILASRW